MTHIAIILQESPVHAKVRAHVHATPQENLWTKLKTRCGLEAAHIVTLCTKKTFSTVFGVKRTWYKDVKRYVQHYVVFCKKLSSF